MELKGHLLYYPEGKHDINLDNYVQKSQLNDALKSKVDSITKTTYADLKNLRDNSQLIPGALYRITDYQCTTTQENTQSAGHQFDIVLLALSENKLSEEGWAMMHDTPIYDVIFTDDNIKCYLNKRDENVYNIVSVETLLGIDIPIEILEPLINEESKTINVTTLGYGTIDLYEGLTYNYFQNSNLSAWKVWYCLDNDKSRFAWAQVYQNEVTGIKIGTNPNVLDRASIDDKVVNETNYFAWKQGGTTTYTLSETPQVGDNTWALGGPPGQLIPTQNSDVSEVIATIQEEGKGVIYRLIDEFNNDIKYDFKNIQFKRTITDGQYDENGTETWCYTLNIWYNDMCQDASIVGNTMPNDEGYVTGVYDNIFGYATAYNLYIEGVNTFAYALGNNVVLSFDDDGYLGIYSNTIGDGFHSNTIGNCFNDNTIGNYFERNTIGNDANSNIIGNHSYGNTIGNTFNANTIGNYFNNKTISDNTILKNYGNSGVELATKDDLN